MLAAHHDQENRVVLQPANGGKPVAPGTRHLQPKTPGARYPKTPLKVPLNDENAVLGGKSILTGRSRIAGNEQGTAKAKGLAPVTPMEPRTRAPLGNKTTNAKAKTGQQVVVKDMVREIEKTQIKPTTVQKPRQLLAGPTPAKVAIHSTSKLRNLLEEPEIEYCPPRQKEAEYESDVIPPGALTCEGLKPENLFRGYYATYYNPLDDDGVSLREKEFEEKLQKALEESDKKMLREIEECDWSVCDVPETKAYLQNKKKAAPPANLPAAQLGGKRETVGAGGRYPPTITSKTAASVLSMDAQTVKAAKAGTQAPQRLPKRPTALLSKLSDKRDAVPTKAAGEGIAAEAASRSTIGYTKGRSASSAVQRHQPAAPARDRALGRVPGGNAPAGRPNSGEALLKLQFLSIFDLGDDADEGLYGVTNPLEDDADEDFELRLDL